MKFLKWAAIVIGVLVVVCCGIGLMLPDGWDVETSVVIDAPPETIHPLINTPRTLVTFTEAFAKSRPDTADTKFEFEFSEIESGQGAWWVSKARGSRVRIEITESDPVKGIWYDGAIRRNEINAHGSITFEPVDGGTKVVWRDAGSLPAVAGGLLGPFVNSTLETFLHGTLLEIKEAAEAE